MVALQQGTTEKKYLDANFTHKFDFVDGNPSIDAPLQVIRTKIFEDMPLSMTTFHQSNGTVQHWMECYNMTCEDDDDDTCDINIPECGGSCIVEELGISSDKFLNPLKIKKVNIGSLEN